MTGPASLSEPRQFERGGVCYQITLPTWGQWLAILDQSARGMDTGGQADVSALLRGWLARSVAVLDDGSARPLGSIDALPAELADALVAEGSAALEVLGAALEVRREDDPACGRIVVSSALGAYHLRPLRFGERNACLARHLGLRDGQPTLDASGYEVALVAASLTAPEGLRIADLHALPLPLGEALVTAARALSDSAPEAELIAFAQAGQPHPDLELAQLCLAFGMTPQEAMDLPADTARRLGVAAALVRASQPLGVVQGAGAEPEDDRATRIVVHDD